jgi:putative aldouronate transport system permease protein
MVQVGKDFIMVRKDKGFQFVANLVMIIIVVLCLAPFVLLVMSSFTDEKTLAEFGYSFWPRKFSTYAYEYLFTGSGALLRSYSISFLVTAVGTVLNLALTILYAYPISRRDLPGRNLFAFFLFFTMLFNGGLVPSYIMWTRTFHINNTIFALIIPNLMLSAFNVIMMRTFFNSNIPDAIIEAARIDGASELTILGKVVLPMSKPILATVGLLVGLGYWNDWQNGLYYINNTSLYSIQVLLMNIQRQTESLAQTVATSGGAGAMAANLPSTSIRMAITVMGVLPVMIIYPFVQQYFVKGIAIGAVKG